MQNRVSCNVVNSAYNSFQVMSDVKCLCVGDVNGQFKLLVDRVNAINTKVGVSCLYWMNGGALEWALRRSFLCRWILWTRWGRKQEASWRWLFLSFRHLCPWWVFVLLATYFIYRTLFSGNSFLLSRHWRRRRIMSQFELLGKEGDSLHCLGNKCGLSIWCRSKDVQQLPVH